MAVRSILLVVGLLILGCAAPTSDTATEPVPVVVAPTPEPPTAPSAVDTGDDAVAEAPDGPGPREVADGTERARKRDPGEAAPETTAGEGTPDEPETPEPKAKRPIAPKPDGIEQVKDRTWTVTRSLVNRWQEDPFSLGNVRENGEGWEMIGARKRPAYHLGMRNGDIVLEVNGHKLNTMPNLLLAYAACKNDTRFDVVFLRNGARVTHHYEIR